MTDSIQKTACVHGRANKTRAGRLQDRGRNMVLNFFCPSLNHLNRRENSWHTCTSVISIPLTPPGDANGCSASCGQLHVRRCSVGSQIRQNANMVAQIGPSRCLTHNNTNFVDPCMITVLTMRILILSPPQHAQLCAQAGSRLHVHAARR
eukprot:2678983-Pleurochrysis_carterae.AAC.1